MRCLKNMNNEYGNRVMLGQGVLRLSIMAGHHSIDVQIVLYRGNTLCDQA